MIYIPLSLARSLAGWLAGACRQSVMGMRPSVRCDERASGRTTATFNVSIFAVALSLAFAAIERQVSIGAAAEGQVWMRFYARARAR